ncbi:hypothetical protein H8A97_36200 [Bradyrhizobium sp. Arg62]|nr:LysR substrate-binding domain-containing protein [Bradyrhizobium brasilense]MCC8950372.1 hypothetical protein [Bradyrhizobium brasilense]
MPESTRARSLPPQRVVPGLAPGITSWLHKKLFEAGLTPLIQEIADEKQTIVNMVAARLGVAIVPRWTARMAISGVRFVPLRLTRGSSAGRLPLAAAWLKGSRDPVRDQVIACLRQG